MSHGSRDEAAERPRTAGELVARGREFLEKKHVPEARLSAELLVAHALALTRLELFLQLDRPVVPAEIERAREALVRRGRREPTAYITGEREFYGRPMRVSRGVLVPRPETELLVDRARALAGGRAGLQVGDFGTGSGCIAITLALELERPVVRAVDGSETALECARANAERLGATVHFARGTRPADLAPGPPGFDLLLSNPPYVTPEELAELAPEVREFEPHEALLAPPGEPDHWLVRLVEEGLPLLALGGVLLVELGHRQGPAARALAEKHRLQLRLERDLAGIERVAELREVPV